MIARPPIAIARLNGRLLVALVALVLCVRVIRDHGAATYQDETPPPPGSGGVSPLPMVPLLTPLLLLPTRFR